MTTPAPTKSIVLKEYIKLPEITTRFASALGTRDPNPYLESVLIAVSGSDELMKCSPQSVVRSALRAASLGLSCDPALKQAWLVPYSKKDKKTGEWVKEAQFQPHYKGLYTLAMRTGKYWQINVAPVYEGQRVFENPLTGLHAVMEPNGFLGQPASYNPAYSREVTVRRQKDQKVIGWLGYFKTKKGFEKSVYMSVMEIDDHARKYVKDYDKNPNWNDAEKRAVMEMKTVLRQLLSWADLSGNETAQLVEALKADGAETIEAHAEDVIPTQAETTPAGMTYEQAADVRFTSALGEIFMGNMSADNLNAVYLSEASSDEQKQAAAVILKHDFQMDPPEVKKPINQNMKELGF